MSWMEPFPVDPWLFLHVMIFGILAILAFAENAGKKKEEIRYLSCGVWRAKRVDERARGQTLRSPRFTHDVVR